jgi:opacity protein-like surface antigen
MQQTEDVMRRCAIILLTFVCMLCLTTLALGQNIGIQGIGGRLGFVLPEDPIASTIGLGVHADLGTITKDFHLSAFGDFWRKSYDHAFGEWSLTQIGLGATAKYLFQIQSLIQPYAGAGLGFTIGHSSGESDYTGDEHSEWDFDLGMHLAGGAEYPFSSTLRGCAELNYHINGADYLGIWFGVTYMLPK